MGLRDGELEHLFESFYMTKAGGKGMGLAICRSMPRLMASASTQAPNEPGSAVFRSAIPVERHDCPRAATQRA
ncbi:hypothetical protein [Paraburkholderia sp. CI2]|uniref:hypothetical protein n=1 Tax=Paraburkholderia sp. CI2 TaxID=2723093 RepID=UPI0039080A36